MNSVKPPTVRFSGYTYNRQKSPELFLPGFKKGVVAKEVRALITDPDGKYEGGTNAPMEWNAEEGQWRSTNASPLKPGMAYRFQVKKMNSNINIWENVTPDALETVDLKRSNGQVDTFNRIARHDLTSPKKSTPLIDYYADSVLTQKQLEVVDQRERARLGWEQHQSGHGEYLPVYPMRNHFNKFNRLTFDQNAFANAKHQVTADVATQGFEDGLNELIPEFRKIGFQGIVFKPFFGGDNLSSHRYWTSDPYVLNDTFRNKQGFRNSLDLMLKNGMKVFADGAFVNQGMNGVQIMSNLHHKTQSPYWDKWFHFSDHETGNRTGYPSLAHEKYEFGLLPTIEKPGESPRINYDAFDVRVINNPDGKDMYGKAYDKNKPTFIEFYDPRLETEAGQPLEKPSVHLSELKNSKGSVQHYRFPVNPAEWSKKRADSSTDGLPLDAQGKAIQKAKYLDWGNFRLTVPGKDNSSKKWDGQIDVALMNTKDEEVMQYLKGAVNYWSNMVMNHYTGSVAEKLYEAKQILGDNATPEALINAVTEGAESPIQKPALKILPKQTEMDSDRVLPDLAETRPDFERKEIGTKFAETLIKNVPLNTLQLPILFKANLNEKTFLKSLNQPRTGFSGFIENKVLTPMASLPVVGKPVASLNDWLFPPRLQKAIGGKMQQIFEEVSTDGTVAEKLRHQKVQNIVADRLGEKFYLSLLTGKSLKESEAMMQDPDQLEQAIYQSLPPSLMNASPQEAARRLPALMRKRIQDMNKPQGNGQASLQVQVRDAVKEITQNLDPTLVNLAAGVLNQREFGLNWRLDAAKDVADIDRVRNAPNKEEKIRRFKEEIEYLKQFWGNELKIAMRDPFSNASVIAELTDFGELAGGDHALGEQLKKMLFDDQTFTSTPNMSHTYSPLAQLVHYAQRPDEFGNSTLAPSEFMAKNVLPMTRELPLFSQRQLQNLSSSHDFSTTSHAMLLNPELFNMDRLTPPGLVEFFKVAANELMDDPSFEHTRDTLEKAGFKDPKEAIKALKTWLAQGEARGFVPGQLRALAAKEPAYRLLAEFYDEQTKNGHTKAKEGKAPSLAVKNLYTPTPQDAKSQFVKALFQPNILPAKLQEGTDAYGDEKGAAYKKDAAGKEKHPLRPLAGMLEGKAPAEREKMMAALSDALTTRMKESSETKAMRAAIGDAVTQAAQSNADLKNPAVRTAIWKGLDEAAARWGSHFGYQGLDVALNHVFETAHAEIEKQIGFEKTEQLKVAIYNQALKPVMAKQERIFAIQNALPGNPSVYLPDLFLQGGSEYTKNIYVQNRAMIRSDRLSGDNGGNAGFNDYWNNVGNIFNSRTKLPALNDGIVLPLDNMDDADKQGILPIVRDNGKQQVIALIDTGKPGEIDKSPKNLERKLYPVGDRKVFGAPENRNLTSLNLKSQHLTPGSTYEDVNTEELFKLDDDFNLKPTRPDGTVIAEGIKLGSNRILVRKTLG